MIMKLSSPPLHVAIGASPPTNVSAQPASPTSIRISWTPPASGAAVVGYRIYYQAEGEQGSLSDYGSVDVGASSTQHTLSDLQGGLLYTVTMVTKSHYLPSTVAGPVTAVLGKYVPNNWISQIIVPTFITISVLAHLYILSSHRQGEGCQRHSTVGVLGCFKEHTPLHHLL